MSQIFFKLFRVITIYVFLFLINISLYSQIQNVENISQLRALIPGSTTEVNVAGYYVSGDGGGGSFFWDPNSRLPHNGGIIIVPSSNPSQGRWLRDTSGFDYYSVKWFGARGQDNPSHGDYEKIMNCVDAVLGSPDVHKVFFPVGVYQIDRRMQWYSHHSGLTLEGENLAFKYEDVYPTTVEGGELVRLTHDRAHIPWSSVESFRVVDESNSAVLKRADGFFTAFLFGLYGTEGMITNFTVKNLAFNGNRWDTLEIPYPDGIDNATNIQILNGSTDETVKFENIASYLAPKHGIAFNETITIKKALVYSNNWHGIVGYSRSNYLEPAVIKDVEVHHCGNDEQLVNYPSKRSYGGAQGMDIGPNTIAENIWLHHNWEGTKSVSGINSRIPENARLITYRNVVSEYNRSKGIQQTAPGAQDYLSIIFENCISRHNGDSGFRVLESNNVTVLGRLHLQNNAISPISPGLAAGLNVRNINAERIIIENHDNILDGGSISAADIRGNNRISNLDVLNNNMIGMRILDGIATIRSGMIINNKAIGISLSSGVKLEITNVKFGDTQINPSQTEREISGVEASLKHNNLDFTNSIITPAYRIRVMSIEKNDF